MTKSIATQTASFALAVVVTFGAFAGVSGVASLQRTADNRATMLAMTEPGVVQHVTVVAHRHQQA